jgi:acyl dehydratase
MDQPDLDGSKAPFLLSNAEVHVGKPLGISGWVDIDQIQVNIFGEVSRWRKPGHCDPETAKNSVYGGTLIHGFHMVSLLSHFFEDSGSKPEDGAYSLNYGLDKVRILQPVVIGNGVRLRSHVSLLDAADKGNGQRLLKTCHEIEVEGTKGHVMYAEYLAYWYPKK